MSVTCQILVQKSTEGVFRPREPIKGTLNYNIDKATKFTCADISLRGIGKSRWTERDASTNKITTYGNTEEYVNICKSLLLGQNVVSGAHKCPFEFFLPENIPTSMKNKICTIEYKVVVIFVEDNFFRTNYKFETEVPVYGYVNPCSPEPLIFGLKKNLFSLTANNNIDIKAEIEKTFVTPGENIKLNLTINNDTNIPITIKTELIKYFTYVSDCYREKIDKAILKTTAACFPSIKQRSVREIKCTVPTLPNLYSIQHTKILIGEYKVRVTANVSFPHTNAVVEIPVVIGENKRLVEEIAESAEDFFAKYDKNIKD